MPAVTELEKERIRLMDAADHAIRDYLLTFASKGNEAAQDRAASEGYKLVDDMIDASYRVEKQRATRR